MTTVYFTPRQYRTVCGRDGLTAKHAGRGLPMFMTRYMDNLALNTSGPLVPPGPIRDLTVNLKTDSLIEVVWNGPNTGGLYAGSLLFITTTNTQPDPTKDPGGVNVSSPTLTYTFTGLTASTLYYIWAFSYNISGYGSVASVSTTTDPTPVPGPVRSLATGTITAATIPVNWLAPNTGGTYTSTKLFITTVNTAPAPTSAGGITVNAPTLTYTFTTLTASTLYYIWAYAQNATGYSTVQSVSGTTLSSGPIAPTGLSLGNATATSLLATWIPGANADETFIWLRTTNVTPLITDPPTDIIPYPSASAGLVSLSSGTTYYFWAASYVSSTDTFSSIAGPATAATLALPGPVTDITRQQGTSSTIVLTWTLPTSGPTLTGIKLIITTTPSSAPPSATGVTISGTATTYTYTGLTPGNFWVWIYTEAASGYTETVGQSGALSLTAVPGPVRTFAFATVTATSIQTDWLEPNTGGPASSYIIAYTSTNSEPNPFTYPTAVSVPLSSPTYTFTDLASGFEYYIWVWALNFSGTSTVSSGNISTLSPPDAPSGLTVIATGAFEAQIDWNWGSPEPGDVMYVYIDLTNTTPTPGTTTPAYTISYPNTSTSVVCSSGTNYIWIAAYSSVYALFSTVTAPVTIIF